jgi:ABC-2 type transport system ATP-binding protein
LNYRARLHGLADYQKVVQRVISLLGFEQRQNQISGTLSGGWKQRLSLGAALLHGPLLLLLDEPTAGVDPSARRDFWEIINGLSARGITILLSSHNMDEVERCHRISYMSAGKVIMIGSIPEIISKTKLTTWEVIGPNLSLLTKQLRVTPGIEQVNPSFDRLHVSARDVTALDKAISPYRKVVHYKWEKTSTSLEDAFIWLNSSIIDTRYAK